MALTFSVDFESRSTTDLWKSGVYRYAEDPNTSILCMAYAVGDAETQIWLPGDPVPGEIEYVLSRDGQFRAWNATFERIMWRLLPFPEIPFSSWYCTQADAAALGLPLSLGKAARVLNVSEQKDDAGNRLMKQMCKPRRPRKDEDPNGLYWFEDADRIARLCDYCQQDVRVERAIARRIRQLGKSERRIYLMDQTVNDRGIWIDGERVARLTAMADEGKAEANRELARLTGGVVTAVTQVNGIVDWCNSRLPLEQRLPDLTKATVRDTLELEIPAEVAGVLQIRQDAGKTSTSKLESLALVPCADGRARGLLQYHGAATGRWAGRLIQPQNLPKGMGDPDSMSTLQQVAAGLRGCVAAAPGRTFMSADFKGIEARVLAWLAGEKELVQAFMNDEPVYEQMAAKIFRLPVHEISNPSFERDIGKATVLGGGFGMGHEKFADRFAIDTGVRLTPEFARKVIRSYRSQVPGIRHLWKELNTAAIVAVQYPGKVTSAAGGRIRYVKRGEYLWCLLPCQRPLAYCLPRLVDHMTPWGAVTPAVQIMRRTEQNKWRRRVLYGGWLTENVVQAIARDLMVYAMQTVEAAGYPVVLTVHDEVLTEPEQGHGSLDEFFQLMKQVPSWGAGIPVEVEGWEGGRYRK